MHGWLPPTVQVGAVLWLVGAIGWRSRHFWVTHVPVALGTGVALASALYWYFGTLGQSGVLPPKTLWLWLTLAGSTAGVGVLGWRGARWRRRASAMSAGALCLLSAALVLNAWAGYLPTVYSAWNRLTAGPLAHQTDVETATAMRRAGVTPANGMVVPIDVTAAVSKFRHRGELVYLPPAWFATPPMPPLPVVMMIGAEINTPSDWLRIGGAASTADAFAAEHGGSAPVLVFVDSGGAFGVDTECVNGSRGNAADHLTKEVLPFLISSFGVSADSAHWGVAGFSTGGTCALDLTVMHPELFSSFVDIAGDAGPNAGTREETIDRLFGGDAAAWASFDPASVIKGSATYRGVSGRFVVAPSSNREANAGGQDVAAHSLCDLGLAHGIDCSIVTVSGNHDWLFAAKAFGAALPWLAGQLGITGR
jgi:S-formylglutathione hydrolase FrmB